MNKDKTKTGLPLGYIALKQLTGHKGAIYKLLDTKTNVFYSFGGDGYVVEWSKNFEANDGRLLVQMSSPIFTASLLGQEEILVAGCMDGSIVMIDIHTKKTISHQKMHTGSVYTILAYQEGYLSGGADGCFRYYDYSGQLIWRWQLSHQAIRCIVPLNDVGLFAVAGSDTKIYIVNVLTTQVVEKKDGHDGSVFSLLVWEDKLYSGGRDAKIRWINLNDDGASDCIDAHRATVNALLIYDDYLLSASRDKNIRIWTRDGNIVQNLGPVHGGHLNSVNTLTGLSTTPYFISAGDDKVIRWWGLDEK